MTHTVDSSPLAELSAEIESCRACPRLVDWREEVARVKRAAFREEEYWARPISGFGDPGARVVVLGLAPAAHGGNRTGRVFTGDRSADFLYAGLHRAGFANQALSVHRDDGLTLRDCWVTAAVRCPPPQNRPTPLERDTCAGFLRRELALLPAAQVVVCLGAFGWESGWRVLDPSHRPRPRFGHGAEASTSSGLTLLGCFHPSQQNTFTGKLRPVMLDAALNRARELVTGT